MPVKTKRRRVRKSPQEYRMTRHELLEFFRSKLNLAIYSSDRSGDKDLLRQDVEKLYEEAEQLT